MKQTRIRSCPALPPRNAPRHRITLLRTIQKQLDGRILEKPIDDEHAFSMLSSLSGRKHLVHSGVSIFTEKLGKTDAAVSFCETTEVLFATLTPEEIRAYIR